MKKSRQRWQGRPFAFFLFTIFLFFFNWPLISIAAEKKGTDLLAYLLLLWLLLIVCIGFFSYREAFDQSGYPQERDAR